MLGSWNFQWPGKVEGIIGGTTGFLNLKFLDLQEMLKCLKAKMKKGNAGTWESLSYDPILELAWMEQTNVDQRTA